MKWQNNVCRCKMDVPLTQLYIAGGSYVVITKLLARRSMEFIGKCFVQLE